MAKSKRVAADPAPLPDVSSFGHSSFFRHSTLDIRHSRAYAVGLTGISAMNTNNRDASAPELLAEVACPLTPRQQTINILLFAANVSLIYLGCAVFYVGITE